MTHQTLDMFGAALREMADGPKLTSYQELTEGLLRRLSEKGLTLDQCAGRKMLNRARSTLERHCTEYGIRFPDFIPANMRTHVQFIPAEGGLELTGEFAEAVAAALSLEVSNVRGAATCVVQQRAFAEAKKKLRKAGFEARKGKAPKKRKVQANG